MSSECHGVCVTNREEIKFYPYRQVRYDQGMGSCKKCEKAWFTEQVLCHCCKSKMRFHRRAKKN